VRSRLQIAQVRNANEAKLKDHNAELESRVAERTQMLEESKALITTQNRHLQEILDAIPQMVWVLNPEGKITSVNERWHDYTGLTEHQCVNHDHRRCDIFHPSQQEELNAIWTESSEKSTGFTREILIREHTGNYRWHLAILEPVLDDNKKVVMWVGTFTNVHEEFILEQEIKEAKDLLEAVFNASFDTISILHSVLDDDDKVVDFEWVMANEKMKELTGKSDLIGKTIRTELPESLVKVLLPRFQEVIQSALPAQFEHKTDYAGVKYLHTTAVKVGDGLVVMQQDVTERVKARESLVRLNESLRQKNHALKNINDELNNFAFIASHDLREPIRKIRLYMDQMLHRGKPVIHPDGKLYAAKVLSSAVRMNNLVDGILAFAKINSDSPLRHDALDLDQVLTRVLTDIRQTIAESNARISFGDLGTIIGDELQISQLFQHLILNSIKFQSKGNDPRIVIERRDVRGKEIYYPAANPLIGYIAISITDNGIGFNEEHTPKIFQMFQRLHSPTEFPGIGIGLAICKRVMENHKGFVLVTSKTGEGSTFTCYFQNKMKRS
jgi:PAS domain S-box-containing protein